MSETRVRDAPAARAAHRMSKPRKQNRPHRSDRSELDSEGREARATTNRTKTRLRNVRRLLENKQQDMAPAQRISLQREHESLQHDLRDVLERAQRKKLISKYHMVRFFERRKAERVLRKARKGTLNPTACSNEEGDAPDDTEIHRREVDLNYTLYYPLSQAYVSLYPKDQTLGEEPNRASPIWKEVEEAMGNNTLKELRERRSRAVDERVALPPNYGSAPKDKRRKSNGSTSQQKQHDHTGGSREQGHFSEGDAVMDDSDGEGAGAGFFE